MHAIRHPDLAAMLFAIALCACFGALFAWVLVVPFWLGAAMVGAALFVLGLSRRSDERPTPRRAAQRARCRSSISALRNRAASPPVAARWSKVSDSGIIRCVAMPPSTGTTP